MKVVKVASLLIVICMLLVVTKVQPAQSQTILTTCQTISNPGTYVLEATQPASAGQAPCFDVTAPNVHITATPASQITCNKSGFGITFESSATGGVLDGVSNGIHFKSCKIQVLIYHQNVAPGITVNLDGYNPMSVSGASGCCCSIFAADSQNVHLNFGSDVNNGGLRGTCPGGQISPYIGGSIPTIISGTIKQ